MKVYQIRKKADSFRDAALAVLEEAKAVVSEVELHNEVALRDRSVKTEYNHFIDVEVVAPDFFDPATLVSDKDQLELGVPAPTASFWGRLGEVLSDDPELMESLEQLFKRFEDVLSGWKQASSLCSFQFFQFGELEGMCLGLKDRRCIPLYTRLLAHWDMEHEGVQYETIQHFVDLHGPCPEIDDLIAARLVDGPGNKGFDQFQELWPKIEEWYGDPVNSPVYQRAAERMTRRGVEDMGPLQDVFAGNW